MKILWIITALLLIVSFLSDRRKTIEAVKIAFRRFKKLLSDFIILLALISIALTLLPPERIREMLKGPGLFIGTIVGSIIGSITFIPGFISYPLAGILKKEGVPYTVLAAFLTTMMMVGILTLHMESNLFNRRFALIRNLTYFLIAIITSLAIGVIFGEIP